MADTPYWMASKLYNLGNVPRDARASYNSIYAPFTINTLGSSALPSFVGMDIVVENSGTSEAEVHIDGDVYLIGAGNIETIEDTMFSEVRVVSGGPLTIRVYGAYLSTLFRIAQGSKF